MVFRFLTFLSVKLWIGITATLFDSIRAFLISSTVPIATGSMNGNKELNGGDEGGVL